MNTVFFGSSEFVLPIVEVLDNTTELSLILTTEHNSNGPVTLFAKKHGIELIDVEQFNNVTISTIKATGAPVAILAYFGLIIPKEVLELFSKGIINVHPSLLPKYRGPTPGQAAIMGGDSETGVTIIKLDEEVDHGPILVQKKAKIEPDDTAENLYNRLFTLGATLCSDVLIHHYKGKINPIPQDHKKATFTDHLTRQSGFFDAKNPPTKEKLDRMIRAYFPWPGVWTKVQIAASNKKPLKTNKFDVSSQTLEVRIKFLPGNLIQVEGKKPVSYKDFVNGYPQMKSFIENLH